MEGVFVSGSAKARAVGECVRCLDEVVEDVDVAIQELYVYPERAQAASDAGDEEDEDLRELDGELIDVEPHCGMRWWLRYRSSRCVGTTARACAPSVVRTWLMTRTTGMRP